MLFTTTHVSPPSTCPDIANATAIKAIGRIKQTNTAFMQNISGFQYLERSCVFIRGIPNIPLFAKSRIS
jgi:hypothetical protein